MTLLLTSITSFKDGCSTYVNTLWFWSPQLSISDANILFFFSLFESRSGHTWTTGKDVKLWANAGKLSCLTCRLTNFWSRISRDPSSTVFSEHDGLTAATWTLLSVCFIVSLRHVQQDFSEIRAVTTSRANTRFTTSLLVCEQEDMMISSLLICSGPLSKCNQNVVQFFAGTERIRKWHSGLFFCYCCQLQDNKTLKQD